MKIEELIWDSNFFNLKIGKCIIHDDNEFDLYTFKKNAEIEKYDLIYIFKHNSLFKKNIVFNLNLDLIDIAVEMSKEFSSESIDKRPFELKNTLTDKELAETYLIAEQTSIVSRFHKESMIASSLTKKLYRAWIDNSLNRSFSDGLFIEKIDDTVVGIHVIKTDLDNKTGYFSLTGVRSDIKRKGIGGKLWNQSFQYWAEQNIIEKVRSPLSLQNKESLNFHLKMGFNRIENISYVYHYRKLNK